MSHLPALTWIAADQAFHLTLAPPEPTLELPDGRSVTLRVDAWLALRDALRLVSPEPEVEARPAVTNRGKPWDPADEQHLADAFANGEEPTAIARTLGRSRGAVVARLVRLGLMEEAGAGLRYPPKPHAQAPDSPPF